MDEHLLPVQFRLLYNWSPSSSQGQVLLQQQQAMYPALQVVLNSVPIFRLIDRELYEEFEAHEHWVSASQLWKACGLTLMEGLVLFQLQHHEFHVDFLRPITFPFQDIWVPVSRARQMASTLGVLDQLQWFFDQEVLPHVFSFDRIHRQEIVHNWRVVAIPLTGYSTRALLDYTLIYPNTLELLHDQHDTSPSPVATSSSKRQQAKQAKPIMYSHASQSSSSVITSVSASSGKRRYWRTQMTRQMYQKGMVRKDRLETGLVRWQAWAYEQFLLSQAEATLDGDDDNEKDDDSEANTAAMAADGFFTDDVSSRHQKQRQRRSMGSGAMQLDGFPVKAVWDALQGMCCDLQTLQRRIEGLAQPPAESAPASVDHQTHQHVQQQHQLGASRVFSDSIVIGNMPLKPSFLRQSPALQHLYLSLMMEKLHELMEQLDQKCPTAPLPSQSPWLPNTTPTAPIDPSSELSTSTSSSSLLRRPRRLSATSRRPGGPTAISTATTIPVSTQSPRGSQEIHTSPMDRHARQHYPQPQASAAATAADAQILLHDRMDALEQDLYRVKKKSRKKADDMELQYTELQHQVMALDLWKRTAQNRRKKERAWMLLIVFLLICVIWFRR
ncbi:hypothetical protein BC940DRAFT_288942 [Gongronella butleri]|nr:hypothetical protein BC940DRAFT_288942 [Gongronella butleri]